MTRTNSNLLVSGCRKEQFEMRKSKIHFEVVLIESVKKILEQQQKKEKQEQEKELAEKKESGNGT